MIIGYNDEALSIRKAGKNLVKIIFQFSPVPISLLSIGMTEGFFKNVYKVAGRSITNGNLDIFTSRAYEHVSYIGERLSENTTQSIGEFVIGGAVSYIALGKCIPYLVGKIKNVKRKKLLADNGPEKKIKFRPFYPTG